MLELFYIFQVNIYLLFNKITFSELCWVFLALNGGTGCKPNTHFYLS